MAFLQVSPVLGSRGSPGTGAVLHPGAEIFVPVLEKADNLYNRCLRNAEDAVKREKFPEFSHVWCEDQLERVKDRYSGASPGGPLAEDILGMLEAVLEIIEDAQESRWASVVEFNGRWSNCAKVTHKSGGLFSPSCGTCTGVGHRGGVPRFLVTSHACAYDAETSTCVNAWKAPPGSITEPGSCRTAGPALEDPSWAQESLAEVGIAQNSSGKKTCCCKQGYCSEESIIRGDSVQRHGSRPHDAVCCKQKDRVGRCPTLSGYTDVADDETCDKSAIAKPVYRALLVSYEYKTRGGHLKGTFPDIARVFDHLVKQRGFDPEDIHVLTDTMEYNGHRSAGYFKGSQFTQTDEYGSATEFLTLMQKVTSTLQSGDYFFFHFSGHGSSQADHDDDELDGRDETIIAPNLEAIVDDKFYVSLRQIPEMVNAFVVTDACHSEGFSDLPFNYLTKERQWCTDWASHDRRLPLATITYVSGSQNSETSADVGVGGALSMHLINEWTRPKKMHLAMTDVTQKLTSQNPSLSAFPTFRDTALIDPYDPKTEVTWDPKSVFCEGLEKEFQAPSICTHGDWSRNQKVDHRRKQTLIKKASRRFLINEDLDDAKVATGEVEGWLLRK